MRNMALSRKIKLYLYVVLGMLMLFGCEKKDSMELYGPIIVNTNTGDITLSIGIAYKAPYYDSKPTRYVVKFDNNIVAEIVPLPEAFLPFTWRNKESSSELFGMVLQDMPVMQDQITAFSVSNKVTPTISKKLPIGSSIWDMAWNPSGEIIAVTMLQASGERNLSFFYDNFDSVNITDINMSSCGIVWSNDEVVFVQDGNDIIEVKVNNRKPEVTRTITSGKDTRCILIGCIDEKEIYVLGKQVYSGNHVIYSVNQKTAIAESEVDGNYIASMVGNQVIVFNGNGDVISTKDITNIKDRWRLIALSSDLKTVYITKDGKLIQTYNFEKNDDLTTIFDLDSKQ